MLQRLLYPWHLPPYGLPNPSAFSWTPKNLGGEMHILPEQVRGVVENIRFENMFDFSCAIARQLLRVGTRIPEQPPLTGAVLIANDRQTLSSLTSAHAFLMSMAQPAAFEMAGLMNQPQKPSSPPPDCSEITGVAFFAESASKRGSGRRLQESMLRLAFEASQRCVSDEFLAPAICFTHSKPTQARSPIEGHGVLPMAGYRIRFSGCAPEQVLQALADAIQALPAAHQVGERSDVMVLSNLWTPATV